MSNLNSEKESQFFWLLLQFSKMSQNKESSSERKFAQSGHHGNKTVIIIFFAHFQLRQLL
jgi:hypothetical protein